MTLQGNKSFAEAVKEYDDLGLVKRLLCPFCGQDKLRLSHVDDVGTPFYKCDNCGRFCSNPKTAERKQLEEQLAHAEKVSDEEEEEEEKQALNLYVLAKAIIYDMPIITDKRTYLMLRFNGKSWEDDVESYIQERLVKAEGEAYKPYHLTTLTQMIQGLTFAEFQEPEPSLLCLENGVLDVHTMTLKPHSPEYHFRNMINAEYKPTAKATEFERWLEEVLPDPEARKCIQEIFGYCLYRDYPLHYLFFLVGSGRNGRSTLMRTLQDILGKKQCSSVPLELLPERFQVTNLIGKLVNIVSEPRSRKALDTPIIKKLTGADLIDAEIKGKQKTIAFTNYAKIIVLANELPPVRDTSYGWWERVIVIEFPVTISEEKRVPNIEEKWLSNPEERSGILNWALEGLKRLFTNRCFTKSESMKNQIEQYKRWSQPAEYFLEKYCRYAPNLWITKKELYEAYKLICEEEGLQVLSEENFAKEVKKKPRVKVERRRLEGRREQVWVGLTIKEELYTQTENEENLPTQNRDICSFMKENDQTGQGGQGGRGISLPREMLKPMENNNEENVEEDFKTIRNHPDHPDHPDHLEHSLGDLLKQFRAKFPDCFNSTEFYHFMIAMHGLSSEDAESLLRRLKESGEVFSTYEGVYRWS